MKPKPYIRTIFAVLVIAGSLLLLQGARKVSAENISLSSKACSECSTAEMQYSNTEFIFFETVSKYLVVSFMK